jgi:small subunit ribosomal protein S1
MSDDPKPAAAPDPDPPLSSSDPGSTDSTAPSGELQSARRIKIGSQRDVVGPPSETTAAPAEAPGEPSREAPAEEAPVDEETPLPGFPPPRLQRVSEDLQQEIDDALKDLSLEELLQGEAGAGGGSSAEITLDERCQATVIKIDRDAVFFSLGGAYEGLASLRHFAEPPAPGSSWEVVPVRFLPDDNLYELTIPGAAVDVQDWSDLVEGVVVDARITGHNKGGLDCEVHNIRGFIPISQVSLFRVEDLEPYVGQSLPCVVTEVNPERRNLVLSHRDVLEREKQEAREKLLGELEPGQVREGVVRRLQPFGAFVDLGGIDGLVHVSQLSWDRIAHPQEVLEEGQRIKVRVEKVDPVTGKISLSYRDLLEHPWDGAEEKFPVGAILDGTVSKIMEFGAFVRVAPGVEGLVHISELAHHRVQRVSQVVREGEGVKVKVLGIDPAAQKMSLSIKAIQGAEPEEDEPAEEAGPAQPAAPSAPQKPLKGGLGHRSGGEQFGLKW